jgi:hypothetical protein
MIRTDGLVEISDLPIICWRNHVTATNVSAESDPDYPVTNVANSITSIKWKHDATESPVSSIEYLTVDLDADIVNYVAIAGHNFATAGVAVGLEISTYNSPAGGSEGIFEPVIPDDDGPLIFLFEAEEVQAVRLVFLTTATPVEIAVLYVGQYTELPEGIQPDHTPLPLAKVRDVVNGRSENGAFLGRIITGQQLGSVATIANLSKDYVRDELMPFLDFASEEPFFWIWSPETYPDETAFAWLDTDAQPVFDVDGYASVDLSMKGIGS